MVDLFAHLQTLPDDWDSWLVYADQLTQRGDKRGEMLVLDYRGEREAANELADAWIGRVAQHLGLWFTDPCFWASRFRPLVDPRTPADLRAMFARPISQPIALLDPDHHVDTVPPVLQLYCDRIYAALLAWLDRAFAAPVPGLGRWQERVDERLLDTQQALQTVDAHTLHYYAPAVMSYALRRQAEGKHQETWWLNVSLNSTLIRDDILRDQQAQRFARLERDQRQAIYGVALAIGHCSTADAWGRVWEAERTEARDDWFDVFNPLPEGKPVAKKRRAAKKKTAPKKKAAPKKKPARKRPSNKKR